MILPPRNSTLYKLGGTKFFRASSSQLVDGRGANLQNVSKHMRAIYIPDGYYPDSDWEKCLAYFAKVQELLKTDKDWRAALDIFTSEELLRIKLFGQIDQAGAEALIVAYYCRPMKFRELFLNGVKPHVFIALHNFCMEFKIKSPLMADLIDRALITQIPALKKLDGWKALDSLIKGSDNWPAAERYYFIAKMICHALNYGMRAPTFQINVLEKSEGKVILDRATAEAYCGKYHELFPEINWWNMETKETVLRDGRIYNMLGFPLTFHDPDESDMKDVVSAGPQSTVGCITHIAYTHEQLLLEASNGYRKKFNDLPSEVTYVLDTYGCKPRKWDLLNNSHDSYMTQCPIGEESEMCKIKQYFMNQNLVSPRGEKFQMRSEAQIGFNWSPAKQITEEYKSEPLTYALCNKFNLTGLREINY